MIFKPFFPLSSAHATRFLLAPACVLAACLALPQVSTAAEMQLSGDGTFKPPSTEQLAALPGDLGFSRSDLASGHWSFSVRYEDSARDADPDPLVGRYAGSIRAYRLVIGASAVDLPIDQAQIVVSDGGGGFTNRESIRVETSALLPAGRLRLSWVQVNQQAKGDDLRGPVGSLTGDALPAYSAVAHLATANAFDRFLELRIDRPEGNSKPLLYLSSSQLTVTASPATAP
jgi:hypothetical protein